MSTQKQIEANRLYARKSTSPKTTGGKFNFSRNAVTLGLLAKSLLLPGESADRFNALIAAYISDFNPETPDEFDLVETMAANRWPVLGTWTSKPSSSPTRPAASKAPPARKMRCDRQYHYAAGRLRALRLRAKRAEEAGNAERKPTTSPKSET